MDASLTELLPRLFGSMLVVVAVMWGAARVMKNRRIPGLPTLGNFQAKGDAQRTEVEILGRTGLNKNATVTLVRVGSKTLVLGVTDAQVTLLTELADETAELPTLSLVAEEAQERRTHRTGAARSAGQLPTTEQAWKGLLEQVRERTVRRD